MIRPTLHKRCLSLIKKLFLLLILIGFSNTEVHAQSISEFEYFFGTDPGFGNGTMISATSNTGEVTQALSLPLTGLEEGFQNLTIRALDNQGTWGLYRRSVFYITEEMGSTDPIANITAAEYWFDADPGFGNGTALTISGTPSETTDNYIIPLGNLDEGFHTIGVRSQNTDGMWSLFDKRVFFVFEEVSTDPISNIAGAEYWFDTDPGFGNGNSLTISGAPSETNESYIIPLGELEPGFHKLGLRTQNLDGNWSLYDKRVFYIFDSEEFNVAPITEMEFLYDAELGFGSGQTVPVSATENPDEYLVEIPTDMVNCDTHDLWISLKNSDGGYSLYNILVDVDVFDNQDPTIVVFEDITVELDVNGEASIDISDVDNGTFDDCGLVSVVLNQAQFNYTCSNLGANTVTITATDAEAKVSTQDVTITVVDNIDPVAIAQDITIQLDANGNASITADDLENGSTDNCSIASRSVNITNFDCSNLGANTVNFTVEDFDGNTNSVNATVTIVDSVLPTASAQNITVQLDANGNATIVADDIDISTDNCSIISKSLDITSFDCSYIGNNTVTLTVTDQSGNSNTTTATITVEDSVLPTPLAQDITVQLDTNGMATITADDLENGSTDNCNVASRSININSFDCSNLGDNTVIFTIEDTSGNSNSINTTVTVEDNVLPTASAQNITVQLDANGIATITADDLDTSTDNCSIASKNVDITSFDCSNLGTNMVNLTVTDQGGNSSSTTAIVTVEDTVSPIAQTQDIMVQLDANGQANITVDAIDNGSTDNCSITDRSIDVTTFTCADIGNNQVTLTVTDQSGNESTVTAVAMVQDNIFPNAVAQNITLPLDANGEVVLLPADIDGGSDDNCNTLNLEVDVNNFNCSNLGTNSVTLTITDLSGNASTDTATVTIIDNLNPTAIGQDISVNLNGQSSVSIVADDVDNGSSDNCDYTLSIDVDTFTMPGVYPVVLTIEDSSGNSDTVTVNVTVTDSTLSIDDVAISERMIRLYPNPTRHQLHIETELNIDSIAIYDLTGKKVLGKANTNNQINVSRLSEGVYFIQFKIENSIITKRFVKY